MSLTLLTGGTRSGKSRFAVELARQAGRHVIVVVTAEAGDDEMAARIGRHKAERPADWTTVDAPIELGAAVADAPDGALVVVDCLSVWVANLLQGELADSDIEAAASQVAALAATRAGGVIAVTNEVGSGVVPPSPLGRRFRDVLGRVNALWADAADRVGLVVAGRLLPLRAASEISTEDGQWIPS